MLLMLQVFTAHFNHLLSRGPDGSCFVQQPWWYKKEVRMFWGLGCVYCINSVNDTLLGEQSATHRFVMAQLYKINFIAVFAKKCNEFSKRHAHSKTLYGSTAWTRVMVKIYWVKWSVRTGIRVKMFVCLIFGGLIHYWMTYISIFYEYVTVYKTSN